MVFLQHLAGTNSAESRQGDLLTSSWNQIPSRGACPDSCLPVAATGRDPNFVPGWMLPSAGKNSANVANKRWEWTQPAQIVQCLCAVKMRWPTVWVGFGLWTTAPNGYCTFPDAVSGDFREARPISICQRRNRKILPVGTRWWPIWPVARDPTQLGPPFAPSSHSLCELHALLLPRFLFS